MGMRADLELDWASLHRSVWQDSGAAGLSLARTLALLLLAQSGSEAARHGALSTSARLQAPPASSTGLALCWRKVAQQLRDMVP